MSDNDNGNDSEDSGVFVRPEFDRLEAGVWKSAIREWEASRARDPKPLTFEALCEAAEQMRKMR